MSNRESASFALSEQPNFTTGDEVHGKDLDGYEVDGVIDSIPQEMPTVLAVVKSNRGKLHVCWQNRLTIGKLVHRAEVVGSPFIRYGNGST